MDVLYVTNPELGSGRGYTHRFNSELHPSLSATPIFPLGRAVMSYAEDWADPSESESSTR